MIFGYVKLSIRFSQFVGENESLPNFIYSKNLRLNFFIRITII